MNGARIEEGVCVEEIVIENGARGAASSPTAAASPATFW